MALEAQPERMCSLLYIVSDDDDDDDDDDVPYLLVLIPREA